MWNCSRCACTAQIFLFGTTGCDSVGAVDKKNNKEFDFFLNVCIKIIKKSESAVYISMRYELFKEQFMNWSVWLSHTKELVKHKAIG